MEHEILGYQISGQFYGVTIDKFIIDESQLDILGIDQRAFHMLEGCIKHAAVAGSTSFPSDNFMISVIYHEIDTPRYVVLRGINLGNRFYSRYTGTERHEVKRTIDGKISYEILGFADTDAQAQQVLHGRTDYMTHAHFQKASAYDTTDTHVDHCCPKHGCKYGDLWCPVANELVKTSPGERLCCVEAAREEEE